VKNFWILIRIQELCVRILNWIATKI